MTQNNSLRKIIGRAYDMTKGMPCEPQDFQESHETFPFPSSEQFLGEQEVPNLEYLLDFKQFPKKHQLPTYIQHFLSSGQFPSEQELLEDSLIFEQFPKKHQLPPYLQGISPLNLGNEEYIEASGGILDFTGPRTFLICATPMLLLAKSKKPKK